MANLQPPAKKKETKPSAERCENTVDIEEAITKAAPKKATEQTPPDAIKPLQLKIPESKKNEFKAYAAMRGRSMNALFVEMFEEYREQHS